MSLEMCFWLDKVWHDVVTVGVGGDVDSGILFVAYDREVAEVVHECKGIPSKDDLDLVTGESCCEEEVGCSDAEGVGCPIFENFHVCWVSRVEFGPSCDGGAHDGFDVAGDNVAYSAVGVAVYAERGAVGGWSDESVVALEDAEHPPDAAECWVVGIWSEFDDLVAALILLGAPADAHVANQPDALVDGVFDELCEGYSSFLLGKKGDVASAKGSGQGGEFAFFEKGM